LRRSVIVVPDWLSSPEGDSVLRQSLPALCSFAERGDLLKLKPFKAAPTPEAAWLGCDPSTIALEEGPLVVAAFGYDPPEKSVHFALSLLAFEDGKAKRPAERVTDDELAAIWQATDKLRTSKLTPVRGEGFGHGLVWEDGSLDLGTTHLEKVDGQEIHSYLPEGDGDRALRRLIDDSANLLSELEFNRIRADEGREQLNLWWPWGQGFRIRTPNLALRRGEICTVISSSVRLEGLTRLCGYRHASRAKLKRAMRTDFDYVLAEIKRAPSSIFILDGFAEMRAFDRYEEMAWLTNELAKRLLEPLAGLDEQLRVALLATSSPAGADDPAGLVLSFDSRTTGSNTLPFDERSLEERRLGWTEAWLAADQALS
jgi:hypothetical protein